MQELCIRLWCDACHAEGAAMVAAEVSFSVTVSEHGAARTPARRLDLCDTHRKLVDVVAALASDHGTDPGHPPPTAELGPPPAPARKSWARRPGTRSRYTCVRCPATVQRASAVEHYRGVHGVRLRQPERCPDCGAGPYVSLAMITHRTRQHGFDYLAELEGAARQAGADPPKTHPGRRPADPAGQVPCPVCARPLVRNYITQHLRTQHGARVDQPERCPDCGTGKPGAISMTAHRVGAHGYDLVADLLASLP
jgi:hypothetical protein